MAARSLSFLCQLQVEGKKNCSVNRTARAATRKKLRDLRLDSREVTRLVSIKVTQQSSERKVIPGDEGDVGNGTLAAHEPFLFGEHRLKDGKDTNDLLLVSLDRTRDLLTVEHLEPGCLTEVRTVR